MEGTAKLESGLLGGRSSSIVTTRGFLGTDEEAAQPLLEEKSEDEEEDEEGLEESESDLLAKTSSYFLFLASSFALLLMLLILSRADVDAEDADELAELEALEDFVSLDGPASPLFFDLTFGLSTNSSEDDELLSPFR